MMMRMLDAGGVALLTDGLRQADEDNPTGYYELDAVKRLGKEEPTWLDERGERLRSSPDCFTSCRLIAVTASSSCTATSMRSSPPSARC